MADDTQLTPEPSGQPAEPTPEPTPVEPEPTPEPTPEPEPPAPTSEDIRRQAAEDAFQRVASWIGRRDKDLINSFGNLINSRIPPPQPQVPAPPIDAATLLEQPDTALQKMGYVKATDIPRILNETIGQQTAAEQRYTAEVVQQASALMESEPLFQGEEGKKLGAEAVEEIQKNFRSLDKRMPPQVAAQFLINGALAGLSRKRILAKTNAFAGRTPVKGPFGTVTPPVNSTAAKPKVPKLSVDAAALAKRWGYSEADLSKVFADER